MLTGDPVCESEEEDTPRRRPANRLVLYVTLAASPIAVILGSALPLWVLSLIFVVTLTALMRTLMMRRKRSTATAVADAEGEECGESTSMGNIKKAEVSWSGEYRYRYQPGLYYGEAVKQVVRALLLSDEEKALRKDLTHRVTAIVRSAFPGSAATAAPEGSGASVSLYGSGASKVCMQGGNLDLCLRIVEELGSENDVSAALCNALWEEDMEEVTVRTRGGKQIVRFLEPSSGLTVDVGINVHEARLAASLMREYASISKRAQQLIVMVKHWAERREICNSYAGGTLNSYGYALMAISFLQRRELPVVPVFPCDRMGCSKSRAASFGGTRSGFQEIARANEQAHEAMREHVGELLVAFFDFYGNEFDAKARVISVRTGELLRKQPHEKGSPLLIEDPIVPDWNVAASVDSAGLHKIRKECRRAARILTTVPASKRLWKRFLSLPQDSTSTNDLLGLSSELEANPEEEEDSEVCGDCSECAQLVRA